MGRTFFTVKHIQFKYQNMIKMNNLDTVEQNVYAFLYQRRSLTKTDKFISVETQYQKMCMQKRSSISQQFYERKNIISSEFTSVKKTAIERLTRGWAGVWTGGTNTVDLLFSLISEGGRMRRHFDCSLYLPCPSCKCFSWKHD